MKLEQIRPGMLVWDVGRQKTGNTTISTVCVWPVMVESVDTHSVLARWNGNQARSYFVRDVKRWRISKPVLVDAGMMGRRRLATRDELKAMKVSETKPST